LTIFGQQGPGLTFSLGDDVVAEPQEQERSLGGDGLRPNDAAPGRNHAGVVVACIESGIHNERSQLFDDRMRTSKEDLALAHSRVESSGELLQTTGGLANRQRGFAQIEAERAVASGNRAAVRPGRRGEEVLDIGSRADRRPHGIDLGSHLVRVDRMLGEERSALLLAVGRVLPFRVELLVLWTKVRVVEQ